MRSSTPAEARTRGVSRALLLFLMSGLDGGSWLPPKPTTPAAAPIRSSLTKHLEISGPLDENSTEKLVQARVPQLRACFERWLPRGAKTYGRYVLAIGVGTSGAPTVVAITADTLKMAKTATCVTKIAQGFRFPRATQEGKLELTLSFASLE